MSAVGGRRRRGRPAAGRQPPRAGALAAVLLLALALLLPDQAARRPPAPGVLGPPRSVPPGLLGFNGEAVTGGPPVWSDPRFLSAVAALRPQAVRVFGGTPANYWDWRAGTFVGAALLTRHLRLVRGQAHVSLADWARLIRSTHATPVFDLNLVTSDLASQLAMLRAARRLGMPVTHVELGNELYLPVYSKRFPDGAAYGRVAAAWISAIARRFPGVQAAVDGFPGRDTNATRVDARARRWNSELLRTVRGEAAISFHAYFGSGLPPGAAPTSIAAAQTMLGAPARRWARLARVIAGLPPGVAAWVTEWNLFDSRTRAPGTWTHGLAVAAFAIDLITTARVVQADYHALVNNAMFAALLPLEAPPARAAAAAASRPTASSPSGLYAGGVAMQALLAALAPAASAQRLTFAPDRSVTGAVFTGVRGAGGVLVNASAEAATVALPRVLRGLPYHALWAAPDAVVAGPRTLHPRAGATTAALDLEPFSLVRIGPAP